jgi:hypothetical protein
MEESQMQIKKLVIPATLALSMAFSFVPTMTFTTITAVAEANAYKAPATTAVKLSKGEVTVYDFGSIKLHSYKTNDVLSDVCYVLEGKDGLVLLESTAFKENVQELNNYMKSLKKPLQGMFLSYHSNGYNTYPAVPIYATEKALASWGENGGVSALTNNFVQAFGDTVDTNLPAKAAIVRDGDTVKVAGIDFKILPTPDVDYLAYADEFQRLGTLFNDCVKEYHSTGELDQVRAEAVWSEIKEKADRLRNELIEKTVDLKVEALHGKE